LATGFAGTLIQTNQGTVSEKKLGGVIVKWDIAASTAFSQVRHDLVTGDDEMNVFHLTFSQSRRMAGDLTVSSSVRCARLLGALTDLVRAGIFEPTRQCQLVTSLVSDFGFCRQDGPIRLVLSPTAIVDNFTSVRVHFLPCAIKIG